MSIFRKNAAATDDALGSDADAHTSRDVGAELARLTQAEEADRGERGRQLAQLAAAMASSARAAGAGAVASGRWLTEVLLETAPRIPIRDRETLREHHAGLRDDQIVEALIKNASRTTAAIGAAAGAVASASWLAPPSLLVSAPIEIAAETLAVAAVETKLIAELHALHDVVPAGTPGQRAVAYVGAWATGRGLDPMDPKMITTVISTAAKSRVRRRLIGRATRGLTSLGPLLSGAVAGAMLNGRATTALGRSMNEQLHRTPPRIVKG